MKNKKFFVLIILLVIGFASISTALVINGNTKIAANLEDFDVIFIEGLLDGKESTTVEIDSTKKKMVFTTDVLINKGDITRLDYKVKNTSSQYDANIMINCTNEANEFVNVTSSFDNQTLPLSDSINMEAQEIKSGYITAELIKPSTDDLEILVTCEINVNATSRTNYMYSLSFDSNGGTSVEDKIVEYNKKYGSLSIPEKEGYTFLGWYNESDELVTNETILDTKENKKLYAKWEESFYTLTILTTKNEVSEYSNLNIKYGESISKNIEVDDNSFISNVTCNNGYKVENYNSDKVIYGSQEIKLNNNGNASDATCNLSITQGKYEFIYNGGEQTFTAPLKGEYKVELWGAEGGSLSSSAIGGKGSYVSGVIDLTSDKRLFVNVGGSGNNDGYNGGGEGNANQAKGGGATDIRINGNDTSNRTLVAAGGGGAYLDVHHHAGNASSGGDCYTYVRDRAGITCNHDPITGRPLGATSNCGCPAVSCGQSRTTSHFGDCRAGHVIGHWHLACGKSEGQIIKSVSGSINSQSNNTLFQGSTGGGGGYYGGNSQYAGTSYASNAFKDVSTSIGNNSGNGYAKITYLGK